MIHTRWTMLLLGTLVLLGMAGCGPNRIEKDDAQLGGIRQVLVPSLECAGAVYLQGDRQ